MIRSTPGTPVYGKPPVTLRAVLYLRVSRDTQDVGAQLAQLHPWAAARGWNVLEVFTDEVSGDERRRGRGDPPGLRQALRMLELRRADVIGIWAADRLVRSPAGLLQLVARIQAMGGQVASYQDGADLDTTTDMGELLTFLRGWFARMELRLIRARTIAGLERARAAGVQLGPPRKGGGPQTLVADRQAGKSWAQLAEGTGLSPTTIRRRYYAQLLEWGAPVSNLK